MRRRAITSKLLVLATMTALMTSAMVGCGQSKEYNNSTQAASDNFNSTGYPVVNETIEINAMTNSTSMHGDFNNMGLFKEVNELTNVHVKFDMIPPSAWTEQKNLTIASNTNLPDIFYGGGLSTSDINSMGTQGMVIPLEDLIKEYAPNLQALMDKDPALKKAMTSEDGHIYSLPKYDKLPMEEVITHVYINKKWLDKLGLEVPQTIEEFEKALRLFKTEDPNGNGQSDEIPFSYLADNSYWGEYSMFGSWGVADNASHLALEDGKVVFTATTDGYKEGMKWFTQLYKDGIVDREIFTQEMQQYSAKGMNEESQLGAFISFFPSTVVGGEKVADEYVTLPVLKGPNGQEPTWSRSTYGYFPGYLLITNENKNPEATMRWANEMYDSERSLRARWGELDVNMKKEGDKYIFLDPPAGKSFDSFTSENAPTSRTICGVTEETYDKVVFGPDQQRKKADTEMYNQYTLEAFPVMKWTADELNELSIYQTDINNYVQEMKGKWITGESDIDKDWNNYCETIKKMNVDKYVALYQTVYERSK